MQNITSCTYQMHLRSCHNSKVRPSNAADTTVAPMTIRPDDAWTTERAEHTQKRTPGCITTIGTRKGPTNSDARTQQPPSSVDREAAQLAPAASCRPDDRPVLKRKTRSTMPEAARRWPRRAHRQASSARPGWCPSSSLLVLALETLASDAWRSADSGRSEGPVKEYAHAGKEGAAVRMGRVAGRQTCARARWSAPEVHKAAQERGTNASLEYLREYFLA